MSKYHDSLPSRRMSYGAQQPTSNLELVNDQLRLASEYYNRLINLERRRRYEVRDVTNAFAPDYAALSAEIEQLQEQREQLRSEIKKTNAALKSKMRSSNSADTKTKSAQIRTASEQIKQLSIQAKARRVELYGDPKLRAQLKKLKESDSSDNSDEIAALEADNRGLYGDPELGMILSKLDRTHQERVRQERANCQLYWGSYLLVEGDVGRAAASKEMPRCRPFTGYGRLGVQLQKGLSVSDALGGSDTRIQIGPVIYAEQASHGDAVRHAHTTVRFRVGSDGRNPVFADVPCWIDRALPESAMIKWVTLHKIKRGLDANAAWELQFTVSSAAGFPKDDLASSGACGIDINWRRNEHGGLCVACACGTDGDEDQLYLPDRFIGSCNQLAELASRMDNEFNQARVSLLEFLGEQKELPGWLTDSTETLAQWRSHQRLELLVRTWRDERFSGDEHIFDNVLWPWRGHWIHLIKWRAGALHNVIAHRLDIYRKWAAQLRRRYARAFIENINWKQLQDKRPAEVDDGSDAAARRWRKLASPGILCAVIENSGMLVTKRPAQDTTRKCHLCDHIGNPNAAESVIVTCENCGRSYDQQARAAWNLLNDGLASGDVARASAGSLTG